MLYPSRHSGVQYKGIRTAPYMMQFINAVMNPIVRITSRMQLINLLLENDVGKIHIQTTLTSSNQFQ